MKDHLPEQRRQTHQNDRGLRYRRRVALLRGDSMRCDAMAQTPYDDAMKQPHKTTCFSRDPATVFYINSDTIDPD